MLTCARLHCPGLANLPAIFSQLERVDNIIIWSSPISSKVFQDFMHGLMQSYSASATGEKEAEDYRNFINYDYPHSSEV